MKELDKEIQNIIQQAVNKEVNQRLQEEKEAFNAKIDEAIRSLRDLKFPEVEHPGYKEGSILNKSITELNLSVRSYNALKSAHINTIGDLVTRSERQILQLRNFGKKSLTQLIKVLEERDLQLGMDVSDHLQGEGEEE